MKLGLHIRSRGRCGASAVLAGASAQKRWHGQMEARPQVPEWIDHCGIISLGLVHHALNKTSRHPTHGRLHLCRLSKHPDQKALLADFDVPAFAVVV